MIQTLSTSDIQKLLPKRSANSHKGQNGRVLIIGGSIHFSGAPILAGLGALYSGADLVYLCVPECNFDVSRSYYPDFIVRSFPGDFLNDAALPVISEMVEMCDAIVIGPGLGQSATQMGGVGNLPDQVAQIIESTNKPVVLDAEALLCVHQCNFFNKKVIITPHAGEFARITGTNVYGSLHNENPQKMEPESVLQCAKDAISKLAKEKNIVVLLKGPTDIIASPSGNLSLNATGNPGMTVGGSGDVLAGVVGSLVSQGMKLFDAASAAAFLVGSAGDLLQLKKAYAFSASDIAQTLPTVLAEISQSSKNTIQ